MISRLPAFLPVRDDSDVGYTGSDTINGFRAVGLSFNSVGDVPKYKDLKVTGYTGEYKAGQVYFQLLSASGSKVGQSYMWKDFEYAGDPNDPEDPPASYHGWYGMQTGEDANEIELPLGSGVWFNAPNGSYTLQSAGEVNKEPVPVVTRNGFKLLSNPCPREISYGEIRVTGYTGEYKSAQIYFQLLSASGSKVGQSYMWKDFEYAGDPNDPEDPPASYHGWYGMQTGEDANDLTLGVGQGIWFNAPNDSYVVEFPSAIAD